MKVQPRRAANLSGRTFGFLTMNYYHPTRGAPVSFSTWAGWRPLLSHQDAIADVSTSASTQRLSLASLRRSRCSPPRGWPSTDSPVDTYVSEQHQPGRIGAKVQQQSAATAPTHTDPRRPVKASGLR